MVERIEGLPEGAYGARIWGTLSREEYDAHILPVLEEAVASGRPIRYLLQAGPEFDGIAAGAMWEDAKEGLRLLGEHPKWERTAVVTDVDWIRHAIGIFGWMVPGEVKVYGLDRRDDALAWLGG
jgi:hypothetical protein